MKDNRQFMKAFDWGVELSTKSDQQKGYKMPDMFKSHGGYDLIALPKMEDISVEEKSFSNIIMDRRSRRKYTGEAISIDTLSYLLYTNSGVTKTLENTYLRAYPSGGNRQTFETYLTIQNIQGLKEGIYRYLPLEHALIYLNELDQLNDRLAAACAGQIWVKKAAVTFIWTCIPYRGEWRYMDRAHKVMLLDAGHLCQNLYLACEALDNLGTCAIGAYDQKKMDELISVDGDDEYVIYLSPVGVYR
ncbi:SagB/ThcOx family dehydrogenase [Acidaminobacter sp. JC074]|uniref:SagB/ThcOx family dehydrogenase n=1 Tax=Acidaminobacter sp. JC074 TaxID=2530199 RepID=UPI001F0E4D24|nr:SagB/ThcOx family dehydrogenase [Acidaminobacter sp. JC074]MCH4888373.1 SagB/ThcOx family dehydrogenase [Acidaminobacter sp. JC074]